MTALKNSVEIYAWAPKPYHKFMAFKVQQRRREHAPHFFRSFLISHADYFTAFCQSFADLQHRPQLVDLTVEEGQRLKVIYGSSVGFHVIDVDSGNPYDIYIPSHVS